MHDRQGEPGDRPDSVGDDTDNDAISLPDVPCDASCTDHADSQPACDGGLSEVAPCCSADELPGCPGDGETVVVLEKVSDSHLTIRYFDEKTDGRLDYPDSGERRLSDGIAAGDGGDVDDSTQNQTATAKTETGFGIKRRVRTQTTLDGQRSCDILLEEISPSGDQHWRIPLDLFTSKKRGGGDEFRKLSKRLRRYYKFQDELIEAFEVVNDDTEESADKVNSEQRRLQQISRLLSKITFFINFILLVTKTTAAILSGSLSVISTVIDSTVDLISGAMIWWSGRAMQRRDIYKYPQGYTKIEPIAIVILAVIMSIASLQMIRESAEKIAAFANDEATGPIFGTITIVICTSTIVTKLVLFLICRRYNTPILRALTQDHRNDVLSNSVALACGYLGYKVWNYADPIGAIVICLYIIISWFMTGWEQIKMLTGFTAKPELLQRITWLCINHHEKILLIDTVRAFHFGNNFIVEVDIVLPEDMTVRESHDIAESLQKKIERMPEAERCFVHIDYECDHCPWKEHKIV